MDITFNCGWCKQRIAVDESAAGVSTECPKCGQPITVPNQDATQPEPSVTKQCPYCAETIKSEAKICRFCSYDLLTGKPAQTTVMAVPSPAANRLLKLLGVLVVIGALIGCVFVYRKYQYNADMKDADAYEAQMTAADQKMFRDVKAAVDWAHEMAVNQWFDTKACSNLESYVHAIGQTHTGASMPHSVVLIDGLDISSAIFDFQEHCHLAYDLNDSGELRMAMRQLDEVDRKYSEFKEKNPKILQ